MAPVSSGDMPHNVADRDVNRRLPLIDTGTSMLAAAILAGGQPTGILAITHSISALTFCIKTGQDPAMTPCVVPFGSLLSEHGIQLILCARWR